MTEKEKKATRRAMVILPSSKFAQSWRLTMALAVLYTIVVAPVMLAIPWWEPSAVVNVGWILVDVVCWSDMVLNFFIAPIHHGKMEINLKERSLSYLKGWFIVDLLVNFPWVIFMPAEAASKSYKLGKFFKMPKVLRVVRLLRVFRDGAHYFGTFCSVVALLLAAHYIACFWVATLIDCDAADSLWPADDNRNLPSCPDPLHTYSEGILAGISMVRGSASWHHFRDDLVGDQTEVAGFVWSGTPASELFATIFCLFCSCLLALLFGNIARSLGEQDTNTRAFHKRLENLRKAEELMGLDRKLVKRLQRHYRYFWASGLEVWRDVLQDWALSRDLYNTLAMCYYGKCLAKIPFFSTLDTQLLKQMSIHSKFEIFAGEDIIISAGEFCTALYFIVEGDATVTTPDGTVIHHLVEGSFFGEMCLLDHSSAGTVNVIAKTNGKMLSITRRVMEELCSEELLEVFKAVAFERCSMERAVGSTNVAPPEKKLCRVNTVTSMDSSAPIKNLVHEIQDKKCSDRIDGLSHKLDALHNTVADLKSMLQENQQSNQIMRISANSVSSNFS